MVAYVSSARSGTNGRNAGLMPEAFGLVLNVLLNAPLGCSPSKLAWSLPNTALMRSVGPACQRRNGKSLNLQSRQVWLQPSWCSPLNVHKNRSRKNRHLQSLQRRSCKLRCLCSRLPLRRHKRRCRWHQPCNRRHKRPRRRVGYHRSRSRRAGCQNIHNRKSRQDRCKGRTRRATQPSTSSQMPSLSTSVPPPPHTPQASITLPSQSSVYHHTRHIRWDAAAATKCRTHQAANRNRHLPSQMNRSCMPKRPYNQEYRLRHHLGMCGTVKGNSLVVDWHQHRVGRLGS